MNDFTDRLESWWEHAEQGIAHAGDTVIRREDTDGSYQVYTLEVGPIGKWADVRILHRAPTPKPAWHDAVAVIAQTPGRDDRRVFIRDTDGWWADVDNSYETDELAHASPLIEQKVTDEMVARLEKSYADHADALLPFGIAQTLLAAALGLDPA